MLTTAGEAVDAAMDEVMTALSKRVHERTTKMLHSLLEADAAPEYVGAVLAGMAGALIQELWERKPDDKGDGAVLETWNDLGADYVAQCQRVDNPDPAIAREMGVRPADTPLFQARARMTQEMVGALFVRLSGAWSRADAARSDDGETITVQLVMDPFFSGATHTIAAAAWDWSPEHLTPEAVAMAIHRSALTELKACADIRPAGGGARGEEPLAPRTA